MKKDSQKKGFSIIELLVAVGIFSIVMVIAVGALLSMINANQKAQAIKSVMDNLNLAIESMVRGARVGSTFHCSVSSNVPGNIHRTANCANGGKLFAFETFDGDRGDNNDQEVYRLRNGRLERSNNSGGSFIAVTAEEVDLEEVTFYVVGATAGDNVQPRVVITMRGSAGVNERSRTEFALQATATQREFDI